MHRHAARTRISTPTGQHESRGWQVLPTTTWTGFGIALLSGSLVFGANVGHHAEIDYFQLKFIFMASAAVNMLIPAAHSKCAYLDRGPYRAMNVRTPSRAQAMTCSCGGTVPTRTARSSGSPAIRYANCAAAR